MGLQFITGGSGSGKSTYLYHMLTKEAAEHKDTQYIVLVPDQFTLETQKILVEQSKGAGILNIDVLSFHRLAYRVFEQMPALQKTVLEDMGKMMILRKVFAEQKKNLKYFKKGLYKPGFLDECKSFLCELMQYAIGEEDLEKMELSFTEGSMMACKIQDLRLIFHEFKEKMGDTYMMAEELVPQLTSVVAAVPMLRDSVICLDGFTGFTPTQCDLLKELMRVCKDMYVTVTTDRTEKRKRVFSLSEDTITALSRMAAGVPMPIEEPIVTGAGREKVPHRLKASGELSFLEQHIFSYTKESWEKEPEDIFVQVCRKESEEAAFVARRIWQLVEEGYDYSEIAVVTSDIAKYEQFLARELGRMGIRYFMDYKKSIGANALTEYLMSFMEMFRKGMDYDSTFRFLRGGLSPFSKEETDIFENYVIAQGKRGIRSYQREWEYKAGNMDLTCLNEYRLRFLRETESTWERLKGGKKTVEEFTRILYDLMVDNGLYERILEESKRFEEKGNTLLSKEYKRIYRLLMDLFDELVELLGMEVVTFREYEELLTAGISEGLMGFAPPVSHQVLVGDVERSRLKDIKVLFFIGVNDDCIPKGPGTPGILSERERTQIERAGIELAPLAEKKSYTEQFYLYLTLTKASEKLILTYSKMTEDGTGKRPAYLIRKMTGLFPMLKIVEDENADSPDKILGTDSGMRYFIAGLSDGSYKKDNKWWEIASYYRREQPEYMDRILAVRNQIERTSALSKEAAEYLYGQELYGSVTRMEKFAQCPYAHFVLYGLQLHEREEFSVGVFDYGNVFHRAMEHFSHILEEEKKGWQDLREEEVGALSEACIDYVVGGYKGEMFKQSARVSYMVTRMKQIMKTAVWGIWKQMKQGQFTQMYAEKSFSAKDGVTCLQIELADDKRMNFHGQIDRVDVCRENDTSLLKIVDYKSGQNDLSLDKIYHGLQLQLVTYMAAALELEQRNSNENQVLPAAMLYYQMKESELDWKEESEEERKQRVLEALQCRGYVNEEEAILGKIDHELTENGNVIPGKKSQMIPVAIKKDGYYTKSSHVLSTEQFEMLMKHATKKMQEFGTRIYEGEVAAAPYVMGSENGCEYCELKSVCGVEKREVKQCAREYEKIDEDMIWEVFSRE